ncbi:MAG: hypothetical protein HOF84_04565 [Rhodospirillales bacterium]|nr:hypothetical protein [Rhodospirillales bacterium]
MKNYSTPHHSASKQAGAVPKAQFLLTDRCPIDRNSIEGDVIDTQTHYGASTQFAGDREVEQRQTKGAPIGLSCCPDRPNVVPQQWCLMSDQFAVIPWHMPYGGNLE